MLKKKLFLASSSELKEDRKEFEIFINRKNKDWIGKGTFSTRGMGRLSRRDLKDSAAGRVQQGHSRVRPLRDAVLQQGGPYTEEEFETAFKQFKATANRSSSPISRMPRSASAAPMTRTC